MKQNIRDLAYEAKVQQKLDKAKLSKQVASCSFCEPGEKFCDFHLKQYREAR